MSDVAALPCRRDVDRMRHLGRFTAARSCTTTTSLCRGVQHFSTILAFTLADSRPYIETMDRGEARVAETARLAWARSSSQLEARCSDRARRAWRRLTAYKRVQELVEQDDWVCVWIGLAGFAVLCANAALYRAPMVWDGQSVDLLRGLQTFVLLLVLPMVGLGWRSLGGWPKIQRLLPAFAILSALALLGSTLGKQVESRAVEPSHTLAAYSPLRADAS